LAQDAEQPVDGEDVGLGDRGQRAFVAAVPSQASSAAADFAEGGLWDFIFLDAPAAEVSGGFAIALDEDVTVRLARGGAPALAGLMFRVENLTSCKRALQAGGIAYEERDGALVVPPAAAMGAELSFVA